MATQGLDDKVSLWNIASGERIRELSPAKDLTGAVSWANNGALVISSASGCYLLPDDGQEFQSIAPKQQSYGVVLSRDGGKLATANENSAIELWDVPSGRRLYQLTKGYSPFDRSGLAISPNGQFVAAAMEVYPEHSGPVRDVVRVWDTATGQEKLTCDLRAPVVAIAFSPDGETIAAAGADDYVKIASLSNEASETLVTPMPVTALAFSPDGKLLATGDRLGRLCLWDVATHERVQQISLSPERSLPNWYMISLATGTWLFAWIYLRRRQQSAKRRME